MNNKDYWKKRFIALENANNKKTAEYYSNVEKQFRQANKKIDAEILTWYKRFAINNDVSLPEAKKLLKANELKELHWDVNEYIKRGKENAINQQWLKELENASSKKHITRLEALKLQLRQQVEDLYNGQEIDFSKFSSDLYKNNYYHTAYEIQKGFNIGYDLQSYNKNQLEKVISGTWGADKSNFSGRIWKHKTDLINTLNNEITLNIIKGKSPDEAINNIARKFNVNKNKAGRLVMTESSFIANTAQKDCYKDLDVEKYEIVATLDSHTSKLCQDLDGTVFKLSDYEVGSTAPPFHPYCRSCTCPYFSDNYGERVARDENGEVYYVPSDMKYHDWYSKFVLHEKKIDLFNLSNLTDIDDIVKKIHVIEQWDEFSNSIKDKYGLDLLFEPEVFNLNLDTVKASFAGVEKMIDEFPEIKDFIKVIDVTSGNGAMVYSFEEILKFNKFVYSDNLDSLFELCKKESKKWVKNSNPESLGVHESIHALEKVLIYLNPNYKTDVERILAWNNSLESKQIIKEACDNVRKLKGYENVSDIKLIKDISGNATVNKSECLADAFSDVYVNKNNAEILSREIKKVTINKLNEYKGL